MEGNKFKLKASRYSKLFWNEWQLEPETSRYNLGFIYEFQYDDNIGKLIESLNVYIEKNPLLRSFFTQTGEDELYQIVSDDKSLFKVIFLDQQNKNSEEIDQLLTKYSSTIFTLDKPPLFKMVLVRTRGQKFKLLLILHHIIMDGAYRAIISNEIAEIISGLEIKNNMGFVDEYKLYIKQENRGYAPEGLEADLKYWTELLRGNQLYVNLPVITTSENNVLSGVRTKEISINGNTYSRVIEFSNKNKISIFNIICTICGVLFYRYMGMDNFAFTYAVNMRNNKFKKLTGSYINTLPTFSFDKSR